MLFNGFRMNLFLKIKLLEKIKMKIYLHLLSLESIIIIIRNKRRNKAISKFRLVRFSRKLLLILKEFQEASSKIFMLTIMPVNKTDHYLQWITTTLKKSCKPKNNHFKTADTSSLSTKETEVQTIHTKKKIGSWWMTILWIIPRKRIPRSILNRKVNREMEIIWIEPKFMGINLNTR